jgi:hypothetical protein
MGQGSLAAAFGRLARRRPAEPMGAFVALALSIDCGGMKGAQRPAPRVRRPLWEISYAKIRMDESDRRGPRQRSDARDDNKLASISRPRPFSSSPSFF